MAISTKFLLFVAAALAVILLAEAFAHPYAQAPGAPADAPESRGYAGGHHGRTKWQVYRGPNQGYGGKHGKFAPWGYYLTQPQDKKGGYH